MMSHTTVLLGAMCRLLKIFTCIVRAAFSQAGARAHGLSLECVTVDFFALVGQNGRELGMYCFLG